MQLMGILVGVLCASQAMSQTVSRSDGFEMLRDATPAFFDDGVYSHRNVISSFSGCQATAGHIVSRQIAIDQSFLSMNRVSDTFSSWTVIDFSDPDLKIEIGKKGPFTEKVDHLRVFSDGEKKLVVRRVVQNNRKRERQSDVLFAESTQFNLTDSFFIYTDDPKEQVLIKLLFEAQQERCQESDQ